MFGLVFLFIFSTIGILTWFLSVILGFLLPFIVCFFICYSVEEAGNIQGLIVKRFALKESC